MTGQGLERHPVQSLQWRVTFDEFLANLVSFGIGQFGRIPFQRRVSQTRLNVYSHNCFRLQRNLAPYLVEGNVDIQVIRRAAYIAYVRRGCLVGSDVPDFLCFPHRCSGDGVDSICSVTTWDPCWSFCARGAWISRSTLEPAKERVQGELETWLRGTATKTSVKATSKRV